ncbi:MAG: hypothetical protein HZA66_13445 [Rhodopseudomonas palustris]|uniref:Uncharacterized protein n=1 Tax=Rhodopseudomonas palustris TaxID=1076 RepID=A0A933S0P6_RHOPL|nr:hypothetical protein [Rhodopseudomonas palustris]
MSDKLEPIIRTIERRAQCRPGRMVVAINPRTGKSLSNAGLLNITINRILNDEVLYEIKSDEWVCIEDSIVTIAAFPTNERSDSTFQIRVRASKENVTRIAEALHSKEFSPTQILLQLINYSLRDLLNESARQGEMSAIELIGINRSAWEAEIVRAIAGRLSLDAEIVLPMQRPIIDTDVVIRAVAIPISPSDAPHATFPITFSVVLARAQLRSSEPLPRSARDGEALVRIIIIKAFRDLISLYTYWYQSEEMKKQLTGALSEELGRYAYSLKSIVMDPIAPPIPAEDLIATDINWTGSHARPISFRVQAMVRMNTDGAGVYHARKLDRNDWIKAEISRALEFAMHGRNLIEFTAEAEHELHKAVHRRLEDSARWIGHEVASLELVPRTEIQPPQIPTQGYGPHFEISDNGIINFAPARALDRHGNNIVRLSKLHPILCTLTSNLVEALGHGNIPHCYLKDRAEAYRELIEHSIDTIDFARLYVEGTRLANAMKTALADEDLPQLAHPVQEALDSLLQLHGTFVLATAEGIEIIAAEERYRRTPQEEAEHRAAAISFAESLQNEPNLIDPKAASFVLETAKEIGRGANPERSSVIASGTVKNVSIVVSTLGTLGAASTAAVASGIPALVVASGISALVVGESLKKSKPFAALTGLITKGLDKASDTEVTSVLSTLSERFRLQLEPVLRIEPQLRRLANQREFSWLNRTLDWLQYEPSVVDRFSSETENR